MTPKPALLLVVLLWLLPASAPAAVPEIGVLVERISMALGGAKGGNQALEKARALDFVFSRTVAGGEGKKEWTASHRFLSVDGGKRRRLDIRVQGEGVDSAAVIDGDSAWVVVAGELHEVDPAAVESRIAEFSPARLFSVPLTLATEARQILGEASLQVSERVDEQGRGRFVLSGGPEGEGVRLEVDARSYLPLEVAFRSPSGDVVYRYEDYQQVGRGLVLPSVREFRRNGALVSRSVVLSFSLDPGPVEEAFDRSRLVLDPLDPASTKPR